MYRSSRLAGAQLLAGVAISWATLTSHGAASPALGEAEDLKKAYTALYHKGDYEAAIPLAQQACDILNEETGENSLEHTECLANLATLFKDKGDFNRSATEYKRAIELRTSLLGPNHVKTAKIMNNLGLLYLDQGDYSQAEITLNQVLTIYQNDGTSQHDLAITLGNLAVLHTRAGNFARAEQMNRDALNVRMNLLGPDHPDIGFTLHNLGGLLYSQGEYTDAEKLYKQALEIYSKKLASDHIEIAMTIGDLGMLYLEQERFNEAQSALEKSLSIKQRRLPPNHLLIGQSINNLGVLAWRQDQFEKATVLYRQALDIYEDTLGPSHLDTAHIISNLGMISLAQGDFDTAEPLLQRGISTFEDILGPNHPRLAQSLLNMGYLQFRVGNHIRAADMYQRALDMQEANISRALVIADDRRRLAYVSKLFISSHQATSLHFRQAPHDRDIAAIALTTLLRRKGRVQELVGQSYASLRRSLPENRVHLLDDLGIVQSQYAAISSQGPSKGMSDERRARLAALETLEDSLWTALAKSSSQADAMTKAVTISDVQAKLPGDSVLIEFVKYNAIDGMMVSKESGERRYAAYIISPHDFDWIDLGPAKAIENHIRIFRNAVIRMEDTTSSSRTLYDSIMSPIIERVGLADRLLISPDGDLGLVPFEALKDEYSNYLITRYRLHYVSSGRDLLRPLESDSNLRQVVIVSNPKGTNLPGTEQEAQTISALFGDAAATIKQGDATEARLRHHERPQVLHIATHGVLSGNFANQALAAKSSSDGVLQPQSSQLAPSRLDNPMLYSWLELATPTATTNDQTAATLDDGRLTAYEISGWDLRGTELVTLSACDTGQGTYHQGEGILGLRRAFAIAGAQTQVMSLWKVSDTSTAKLMESYYRRLLAGEGRSEAMRNTQLEMLRNPETSHPRDWAAFVVVGEWGPLSFVDPPAPAEPDPIAPHPRGCQASTDTEGDHLTSFVLLPLLAFARRRREPQRHH